MGEFLRQRSQVLSFDGYKFPPTVEVPSRLKDFRIAIFRQYGTVRNEREAIGYVVNTQIENTLPLDAESFLDLPTVDMQGAIIRDLGKIADEEEVTGVYADFRQPGIKRVAKLHVGLLTSYLDEHPFVSIKEV